MKGPENYLISLQELFVNLTKSQHFDTTCFDSTAGLGTLMECDSVQLFQNVQSNERSLILLTEWQKTGTHIPVNEQGYYAIPYSEFEFAFSKLSTTACFFAHISDIDDHQFSTLFRVNDTESLCIIPIYSANTLWGFWTLEYRNKTNPPSKLIFDSLTRFASFFSNLIQTNNQIQTNNNSIHKLSDSLNVSEIGIWHIEVGNEKEYFFSDFLYKTLGIAKDANEKFNYQTFIESIHPKNKNIIDNIRAYLKQNTYTIFQEQFQVKQQNGQYIWLRSNGRKLTINNKLYFFGTITVLQESEVQKVEQAQMNQQIATILKNVSDTLINLDASCNIIYVSESWHKLTGYKISETIGKSFYDFIAPFDFNNFTKYIAALQLNQKPANIELKLIHINSDELWIRLEASYNYNFKHDSFAFSGAIYPAHQEITAKHKLQESKKRLNRIINTIQDIIYTYAYDTKKCLFISPSIIRFGVDRDNFIGNDKIWRNLIHEEDRRIYKHAHNGIAELGEFNINYRINIEGKVKWINERSWLEKDEIGSPIFIHGILTDITELHSTKLKLEQSEKYFRTVFNKLPSPLLLTHINFDGEIIANNSALFALGILQSNNNPIDLKNILQAFFDSNEPFFHFLKKSAAEKKPLTSEFLLRLPNKEALWFNTQTQPINNDNDLLIVLHSIHERKLAESKLNDRNLVLKTLAKIQSTYQVKQEYSKSLSTTLSNIVSLSKSDYGAICTLNKNTTGTLTTISSIRSYHLEQKRFNQNKESIQYKKIAPLILETYSSDKPYILNNLSDEFEYKHFMGIPILKNRKTIAILGLSSKEHAYCENDADLIEPLIGGYVNFMEAVQLNKERKQNHELYKLVSENSLDIIALFNPDLKLSYISPSIFKVLGYKPEELLNKNPADFFKINQHLHPDTHEYVHNFTAKFKHKSGKIVDLEVLSKTIFDKNGNIKSYLATARDVTIRVQILEELQQSLSKEKEVNKLKSRFVSMTSHEFRTPIATILSSTEISELLIDSIRANETSKKLNKHMKRIKSEVNRLTTLLNDILVFEKQATGKYEINRQLINLNDFFQKLSSDYYTNEVSSYRLIFDFETTNTSTLTDPQILSHIISNLIDNALKYSPVDAKVYVNITSDDNHIHIQIKDHGIGVPKEDILHLFDSFYRASNATNIPGTGLGLAIAKQFSGLLGARISYQENEPCGSIFSIHLPINHE